MSWNKISSLSATQRKYTSQLVPPSFLFLRGNLTCILKWTRHSLILSREGLILTLPILPCPEGWISWSIPVDGLMMRRMSVLHQDSGVIGKSIPSALGLCPREISWVSGNLLGVGDGFPNTSLALVEHGYSSVIVSLFLLYCYTPDLTK